MRSILAAAAFALMAPVSAAADSQIFECVRAGADGSADLVRQTSDDLLSGVIVPFGPAEISWALQCVEAATGQPHIFDRDRETFTAKTPEQIAAEQRLKDEQLARQEELRRASEALREEQARAREALREKEARAYELRQKELEAEREERRAEQERAETERVQSVWRQLLESCETLYRRRPHETITNKMCFDLFLETGLPD